MRQGCAWLFKSGYVTILPCTVRPTINAMDYSSCSLVIHTYQEENRLFGIDYISDLPLTVEALIMVNVKSCWMIQVTNII